MVGRNQRARGPVCPTGRSVQPISAAPQLAPFHAYCRRRLLLRQTEDFAREGDCL